MSLQVEKLEKNMAKLTVEVPAEQFEKAIKKAFNKNKNRFNIPGFRKGKAPQAMIEKMYGVGVFYEDAADEMCIRDSSQAKTAADIACDFLNGKDVANVNMVDYVKVTNENAQQILDIVK